MRANKNILDCQCILFSLEKKQTSNKNIKFSVKKKEPTTSKIAKIQTIHKQSKKFGLSSLKKEVLETQKDTQLLKNENKLKSKKEIISPGKEGPIILTQTFKTILKPTIVFKKIDSAAQKQGKNMLQNSEYFSGFQISRKPAEPKRQQRPNQIMRQASLNDFSNAKNISESNILKRSQSDQSIFTIPKQEVFQQISKAQKIEKTISLRTSNSTKYKSIQQMRPRSIVSSGGDQKQETSSQFSFVIDSLKNRQKTPQFYLDHQ